MNADLRCQRGLKQMPFDFAQGEVRGIPKAKCVALWSALAYNVMHFAGAPLS